MIAHPAPASAADAGRPAKAAPAAASAGPHSPSKWSSATTAVGVFTSSMTMGNLPSSHQQLAIASAPGAPRAEASLDTSCKEDFFCDENDGLNYHDRHHPPAKRQQQQQHHHHAGTVPAAATPGLGAAAAFAADAAALADGGADGEAPLQRTGSFTSRMTPLPKQQHQPLHAPDAPKWRPRVYDQQPEEQACPLAASGAGAAEPASAAAAADAEMLTEQELACAAPLLSCCEALDFVGSGATPAATAAAAAPAEAAAPPPCSSSSPPLFLVAAAAQTAAAAFAQPSSPLPALDPVPVRAAPAGGAGFNPEAVLQLRNELAREAGLRPSPRCLDAHGPCPVPPRPQQQQQTHQQQQQQQPGEVEFAAPPPTPPTTPPPPHQPPPPPPPPANAEFVTPEMRAVVVSWLSEVASEFCLQQETLFSAVSLLDRFLSSTEAVPRGVLQLAAVAACMVACKQDEVGGPDVDELVGVAAGCFRRGDLLRMERILLDAVSWRVRAPTAYTFLHLVGQALPGGLEPAAAALACYLAELAGLDYATLQAPPSAVAGAALLLAQATTAAAAAAWSSPPGDTLLPSSSSSAQWREVSALTGHAPQDLARLAAHLLGLQRAAEREAGLAAAAADAVARGGVAPAGAAAAAEGAPSAFVRDKYAAPAWLCASVARPPLRACPAPPPGL